jgi:dTDP-3-amino-3,6-dideoxy-alpha-D-glucopyranose N,N-dimethyltransferase/dTDP-3-amino-3,4,6-trideoxy-alpha-D-glucopyranose N,N-dimethyltransferase
MKKENQIYNKLSKYYDKIYHFKNYKQEADSIIKIIKKHKKSKGNNLLELGCGTGKHLTYLSGKYNCLGTDLNEGILSEARKLHQNIKFQKVDMTNFNLNEKFDIIICLFSAMGYVKTKSNLKKTIKNISNHLEKGGICIIEGWFSKEEFIDKKTFLHTYEDENLKIARTCWSRKKGNISELNFQFNIVDKKKGPIFFEDKHELGLFDKKYTQDLMTKSGFEIIQYQDRNFRTLYIGVKK